MKKRSWLVQKYPVHEYSLKHRLGLVYLSNYQSADLGGTPVRSERVHSSLAFYAFLHSGTVVDVAGTPGIETYRVVFVDGTVRKSINRTSLRVWSKLQVYKGNHYVSTPTGRPVEMPWHKRRLVLCVVISANQCWRTRAGKIDKHARRADHVRQRRHARFVSSILKQATSAQRSVEQLDVITREPLSRWPTAKRACENMTWVRAFDQCKPASFPPDSGPGGYRCLLPRHGAPSGRIWSVFFLL